jgi:hypothetical protein
LNGFVASAFTRQGQRQIRVGSGQIRLEPYRLFVVIDRLIHLAFRG